MKDFLKKNPIAFTMALFVASMLAVVLLMLPLLLVGLPSEAATALARIAVGVLLMVVFRDRIAWGRSFSGLVLALPVLAIVIWNLVYNLLGGCELIALTAIGGALLLGFAPAVFEETIFRGVGIDALRRGGISDRDTLLVSATLFSLVHLTNAVGMDLASVLVQVAYALVVGLVLGAIYLISGDFLTVVCAHAAIDVSNQVFVTTPTTSSWFAIGLFCVLLVAEAAYACWLMSQGRPQE